MMPMREHRSDLLENSRSDGLTVQGLTKKYGARVVVDSVDLAVTKGRILCLVGPSGSGKSTIINCIAGFTVPDSGRVFLAAREVTDKPLGQRSVTVMFQDYRLFPKMTVRENVSFPLVAERHRGGRRAGDFSVIGEQVDRILEAVSMLDRAASYPHELSGGEKQRAALARALVARPGLLCMDEPLGALDKNLRTELQREIRRLQRETGVTVLYVTHDQQEALLMADELAVIHEGRILQVGTPRDIYQRPASAFVAGFIGECNVLRIHNATVSGNGSMEFFTEKGTPFRAEHNASGTAAFIGLRPEAIYPRRMANLPSLDGTVTDRAFVGTHERATVQLQSGDVLRIFLTEPADVPGVGSPITISYEPASVLVLDRTV
jgi:putative spermidine/putrescine transport system ATP-binding protein